jgi:hypothetical protein
LPQASAASPGSRTIPSPLRSESGAGSEPWRAAAPGLRKSGPFWMASAAPKPRIGTYLASESGVHRSFGLNGVCPKLGLAEPLRRHLEHVDGRHAPTLPSDDRRDRAADEKRVPVWSSPTPRWLGQSSGSPAAPPDLAESEGTTRPGRGPVPRQLERLGARVTSPAQLGGRSRRFGRRTTTLQAEAVDETHEIAPTRRA